MTYVQPVTLFTQVSKKKLHLVVVLIALTSVFLVVVLRSSFYIDNYLISGISDKAWPQRGRAFFISIALVSIAFVFSPLLQADCSLSVKELKSLQQVEIQKIIDGDSVKLSDGQQVRLIGVNTPELKGAEPLAHEARQQLSQLLDSKKAYLMEGKQKKDRYGRLLGHLFLGDGRNIEALMLEKGFGFLVAMPPNVSFLPCLKAARDLARANKIGVWSISAYQAVSSQNVKADNAGFARVSGRLMSIAQSKKTWWLQLDGRVVLRVTQKDQPGFNIDALKSMQGKKILASGWMIDRSSSSGVVKKGYSPFMLLLTHPVHIELL